MQVLLSCMWDYHNLIIKCQVTVASGRKFSKIIALSHDQPVQGFIESCR